MVEPVSVRVQSVIAGKYRLEHELGAGAMGTVWLATHLTLGQQVAVKLISRQLANSKEARQRFDTEAKSAAKLRSRFAVQVYDNGETEDGTPYIVMEYLEGEPLDKRINQQGAIAVGDTVRIVSQVGRALSRAHALNIVHRDLKPANIFLARTHDEGEVAKVLDFGIAKVGGIGSESATQTGAVLGTPLFMSPEQVRGLRSVDYRTDLYSLGMVTYNALTGQYAFSGESFGDLLLAICTLPLPVLHEKAPWLPPTLNDWFQHACARDPAQRFASAEAMMEALVVASGLSATRLSMVEGGAGSVVRPTPLGPGTANLGGAPALPVATGGVPHPVTQASEPFAPQPTASGSVGTSSMTVAAGVPRRGFLIPVLVLGFGLLALLSVLAGVLWWRKRSAESELAQPPASTEVPPPVDTAPPPETASADPIEPAPSAASSASAAPPVATTPRPERPQGGGYVRPRPPQKPPPQKAPPPKPPRPSTIDPGF